MNTFGKTKSKINPRNTLGGILGTFEDDFEKETLSMSSVTQGAGEVIEAIFSLGGDGAEKFPSKGSIEFNKQQVQTQAEQFQKQQAEINRKKDFYQALKKDRDNVQREKDLLFEEEINDIATNLPTEQKNRLLHYQASYKDRSIYQRAELRKKLIEERKNTEKQQKEVSIPSPAKRPNSLEVAFEGKSGSTGNLSFQAVG